MASDEEQLVVSLQVKSSDYERQLDRVAKVSRDKLNQTFQAGAQAGQQMNNTVQQSVLGSIARYTAFGASLSSILRSTDKIGDSVKSSAETTKKAIADLLKQTAISAAELNKNNLKFNVYTANPEALNQEKADAATREGLRKRLALMADQLRAAEEKANQRRRNSSRSTSNSIVKDNEKEAKSHAALQDQLVGLTAAHTGLHVAILQMLPTWALLSLAITGGVAVGVTLLTKKIGDLAEGMNELSASSGVALDKLFKFRAGLGSEDMDKFSGTISGITDKLNTMLANPIEASDFSRGLRALGISFKENSDRAEVMLKIFTQIGRIGNPVKQAAYAKLFGIDNIGLAMIRSGDFQKAYEQSKVDAKNLQALGEEWRRTGKIIDDIFVQMWNDFSGNNAKDLTGALRQFNDLLKENSGNIASGVGVMAKAFVEAASAITTLMTAIRHPIDTAKSIYDSFIHAGSVKTEDFYPEDRAKKKPLDVGTIHPATKGTLNPPWPGAQPIPQTNLQKSVEALIKQNEQLREADRLASADAKSVAIQAQATTELNAAIDDKVEKMRREGASEQDILKYRLNTNAALDAMAEKMRAAGASTNDILAAQLKYLGVGQQLIDMLGKQNAAFARQQSMFPQLKLLYQESGNFFNQFDATAVHAFDGLGDAFANIIDGTKDVKSAFADLTKAILDDIVKMAVRMAITKPLLSAFGFGGLAGFAEGGEVKAGKMIVVGEKGPELFMPPTNGKIVPNNQLGKLAPKMVSGGATPSQTVNINSPITVNATGGTPAQNADLAKQIGAVVERQMRAVVGDELRKAIRPGGIYNTGRVR